MAESRMQKYWWVVLVVGGVAALAAMLIVATWYPGSELVGAFVAFGLLGAAFLWVHAIDRERFWWAIIPGLGALTLMAGMLLDLAIGTESKYDYLDVAVLGIGATIIGLVLKRLDAKMVLYVVAAFAFGVSIAMSPLTIALKVVLIAVEIAAAAYIVYNVNRGRPMTSSHGWLHPQP